MRVEVYPDGQYTKKRTYSLPPPLAVARYPHDIGKYLSYDLVVVPADDEARALTGWQVDPNPSHDFPAQFMLFKVVPQPLQFDFQMVDAFRQRNNAVNKYIVSLWLEKEHHDGSWECIGPWGTAPKSSVVELDADTLHAFTGFYDVASGAPKPTTPTYFGTCPFPRDASPTVCMAYNCAKTSHPNHWRLAVFDRKEFMQPWLNTPLAPLIERGLTQGPAQRLRFIWWVEQQTT